MESSRSFGGVPVLGSTMLRGTTPVTRETAISGGDSLQVTVKSHQIDVQNYLKQLKCINVCKNHLKECNRWWISLFRWEWRDIQSESAGPAYSCQTAHTARTIDQGLLLMYKAEWCWSPLPVLQQKELQGMYDEEEALSWSSSATAACCCCGKREHRHRWSFPSLRWFSC